MSHVAYAPPRHDAATTVGLVAAALLTLGAGFTIGAVAIATALAGLLLASAVLLRRPYVPWKGVLAAVVLVILFLPIRRYRFPGDLPFELEPYRLLVALVVTLWFASLLSDRRVRLRRTGFEGPVLLILTVVLVSVAVNMTRYRVYESNVLKAVTFFLSFVLVFYLVVSVARTRAATEAVVKVLVGGGAVVALLAVLEARTGWTPFDRLEVIFPFLERQALVEELNRGGATRAVGPAEHPIALSAALVMLVPLAVYLVRSAGARWWLAFLALLVGVLSTVSRTGIVMLIVVAVVFLALRPRETKRLWPLLVPLLIVTHFAVPGTLGSIKQAFLPEGGLIQQQQTTEHGCDSAGRLADIGPTLDEVSKKPFFGYGFGTRIVTGKGSNACVLDNQWLGTLLDVGFVGALTWLWLFLAVLRRLGRAAKLDTSKNGWLLVAVTASITGYAVGMATFDALGFIQVTLLLFMILALGAAAAGGARGGLRNATT
jgi:polysaccharide biosynthesis protein PslJ